MNFQFRITNIFFFFLLYFFSIGVIFGCNLRKKSEKSLNVKENKIDTNIFKKDNFINKYGKYEANYLFVKNDVERTKLNVLENGYDSITVRLWYVYFEPRTQVVEIRKDSKGWIAEFLTIKRQLTYNRDTIVKIIEDTIVKNPKSGWQKFTDKLFALNITNLGSSSDIIDYDAPSDGEYVNIEIATKEVYHLYNYPSPKSNLNIKEAKLLEDIMQLIEDEFGVKRIKKI